MWDLGWVQDIADVKVLSWEQHFTFKRGKYSNLEIVHNKNSSMR